MSEKRDLQADLKILTIMEREPTDPVNMVHDVVAPHALRRAIAAEKEVKQLRAAMEQQQVRKSVLWFAQQMEQRLKANDHKGGWDLEPFGYFCTKIHEVVHQLTSQRFEQYPDWNLVINKATDIANYCMMAADNARRYLPMKEDNE